MIDAGIASPFRVQRGVAGLNAYQFKVNTAGQWTVVYQDPTGTFALSTWTAHPALEGDSWTLAVLARENDFAFYANGVLLGTLTNDRLPGAGEYGLLLVNRSDQDSEVTVLFDNALVTTRLGIFRLSAPWHCSSSSRTFWAWFPVSSHRPTTGTLRWPAADSCSSISTTTG